MTSAGPVSLDDPVSLGDPASAALEAGLDNPFWAALRGPLARLAVGDDQAVRFDPTVNIFGALPDKDSDASWKALARLVGDRPVVLSRRRLDVPRDWRVDAVVPGVQLLAPTVAGRSAVGRLDAVGADAVGADAVGTDAEVVPLGVGDAAEMLSLAQATAPGPFLLRSVEQGGFVGIRRAGRLVAMGGLRCQLPGATEISTVCTAAGSRGQGLGSRIVRQLVRTIERTGAQAFLHTAADNAPAIALYERLGFTLRSRPDFVSVRPPLEVRG